jgi:hypothetical protein
MRLPLREFADVVAAMKESPVHNAGSEKRRTARMNVATKIAVIHVEAGKPCRSYVALTQDISLSGIGIVQAPPAQAGQQFLLALPRAEVGPLFVAAKAVRVSTLADGITSVGLEFTQLLAAEMAQRLFPQHAPPAATHPSSPAPTQPVAAV